MDERHEQIGDGKDNYGEAIGQAIKAIKAGAEGGKAAAEIAAGTAVGGPMGAAISAAWSMRHTLFKILISICLAVVFLVALIASLPSIITNSLFGLDGNAPAEGATLDSVYSEMVSSVESTIETGHEKALERVNEIITDGGYDRTLSADALIDNAQNYADYDICYILAAYSASMQQQGTSEADMEEKLLGVAEDMFPVTYEVKHTEREAVNDAGETVTETVSYVECTVNPFDSSVIATAFGIDMDAQYGLFNISYDTAITNMANALKSTIYGTADVVTLQSFSDLDYSMYNGNPDEDSVRGHIINTALTLVGKVPYFWGGKSGPGWNDAWNTPRRVTSAGSPSTGTVRPYGLDCSGFVTWVYSTALGVDIGDGTYAQFYNTVEIAASELKPGDLGFLPRKNGKSWSHVLMFGGYDSDGKRLWVHSTSGTGVTLNTPYYDSRLVLRRPFCINYE